MAKKIGAILTLKDNMTATLKGIRKEQSEFRKNIDTTRRAMERAYNKQYKARIDNTAAMKKIKELSGKLEPLKETMVRVVARKEMAQRQLRQVTNQVKNIGRMAASPVIKVKDQATAKINKIKGSLGALAANPIVLGAGAMLGGGALGFGAIRSGAQLEQQQIAMEHFIGNQNQGMSAADVKKQRDEYLKQLRENSNVTPFETSEVIAAGTRALGVVGGDTKSAMELVKVAEDMAALTPGKTVQDAMEALADAKNGEMERLKEFNAKVSAEEFNSLGFQGVVEERLKSQFEGGSAKLAESGAGLWSTIKGKLGSRIQDTGFAMLENLKPVMKDVIELIDRYGPAMDKFGGSVASGISTAVQYIGIFSDMIGSKFGWVKNETGFLKEAFNTGFGAIKIAASTGWAVIGPTLDLLGNGVKLLYEGFKFAFPGIQATVSTVWSIIEPLLTKLGDALGWVADHVGRLAEWLGKKTAKSGVDEAKTDNKKYTSFHGSHALGLKRVPFDGYIAKVHKDESILSKQEADEYRKGGKKSIVIARLMDKLADTLVVREEADIDKIADRLVVKIDTALANM